MAFQPMQGIRYTDTDLNSLDLRISFVHEILRTQEEKEFRNPHSHGE